jgi:hypothetical protein
MEFMPASSEATLTARLREADFEVVNIHPPGNFFIL